MHQNRLKKFILSIVTLTFVLSHFVFLSVAQIPSPGAGNTNPDAIDTAYYKDQIRIAGDFVNASEFDSCLMICNGNVTELTKNLKAFKNEKTLEYINKYLMHFYKLRGISYQLLSKYPESLKEQQLYLKQAEKINSIKDIGAAYTYIAYTHREMEDYKTALQYNSKAISILQNTPYRGSYANALCGKSTLYYDLDLSIDSAMQFLQEGLKIYKEVGDYNNYTNGVLSLCEQKFKANKQQDCSVWLASISEYINEFENPAQQAQYYAYLGRVEFEKGNIKAASKHFQTGYDYAKVSENAYNMFGTSKYIALSMAASGQYAESIKMIDKCVDHYSDDINTEKARELNSISLKFEFEKEKEFQKAEFAKQAAVAEEKVKRTTLIRNVAIAGLAFVIAVAVILFRLNKKLRISYTKLHETQATLVMTEKQRAEQHVRVNIARDIHDELGSGLTRITMLSGLARKKLHSQPEAVDESLSKITQYSRQVSASLNEIVWAVNPQSDTIEGLGTYMKTYAQKYLDDIGISYQLHFPEKYESIPLDPEKRRNIFLILKESLNNAAKYSNATEIIINLNITGNILELIISDNGIGMDTGITSTGNGLNNMNHRMAQIGFNYTIESEPDKGCTIKVDGKLF
ncbi:MAG: sensor histidine kinase [Bacteroidia bacterium]|nr:sensor histidine kinase [Bacteroidia bacterium]